MKIHNFIYAEDLLQNLACYICLLITEYNLA